MGEAHSFVSFFASFFLKHLLPSISIKPFSVLHFIEYTLCSDVLFTYLCLAVKEAEAGSAEEQPVRNISCHRRIIVL